MVRRPPLEQCLGILRCALALCLGLLLLGLAGCQTSSGTPGHADNRAADSQASRGLPPGAVPDNVVRYEVLAERSDVRFLVFRAGALARLGHHHVVQAQNVRGEILLAPDIRQSRFFIELPVKDFQVDEAAARMDEGGEFLPMPDAAAIAATTRNMLGQQVLDAARYPTIEISSVALAGPVWGPDVTTRIRMRGVERKILVPTAVEYQRDVLVVTATFSLKQSDFGIVPMRVLAGALQVDDAVKVRMRIVAGKPERSPVPPSRPSGAPPPARSIESVAFQRDQRK